jgi:hypothetical protein
MRIRTIILAIGLVAPLAAASGCGWLLGEHDTEPRLQGTVEVQEVRLGAQAAGASKKNRPGPVRTDELACLAR